MEIIKTLQKTEAFLDRTLSTWKTDTIYSEEIEGTKTIRLIPYSVPKVYEEMFKKEVHNLVLLGVHEKRMTQNGEPHTLQKLKLNKTKFVL